MASFRPPGQCPACGEWVRRGQLACDCCGACEKSGWKEDADIYDGLDLPDEDFNYDDFVAREFGSEAGTKPKKSFWWWVAVGLIALFVWGLLKQVVLY